MSRNRRGEPFLYDQIKTSAVFLQLTPEARRSLDLKIAAYDKHLSRQEFFERLARGNLDQKRLIEVFFMESINHIPN